MSAILDYWQAQDVLKLKSLFITIDPSAQKALGLPLVWNKKEVTAASVMRDDN